MAARLGGITRRRLVRVIAHRAKRVERGNDFKGMKGLWRNGMKTLRLGFTALLMGCMVAASGMYLVGCQASTSGGADSADDAEGGCPDEDPFCDEDDAGGGDSDSGDDVGGGSSDGGGDGGGIFGGSKQQKADMSIFDTVVVVKKGKSDKVGKVQLHPGEMKFGMSSEQVAKLYDRLLDKVYVELYKTTPVGPQSKALDYELEERKAQLRRSRLEFGNLPTGLDNGPLKGEYSYNNNESMTKLDLDNGIVRHFFFFNDRLWKIYDEVTLKADSPLGTGFGSAVAYVKEKIGADPKKIEPDFDRGINYEIAEWRDGSTILRLYNREYQKVVAVVFIDESVQSKLPTLRKNRPVDPTAVDPAVRNITRPTAPEDKK
jgi:hypothetical protein